MLEFNSNPSAYGRQPISEQSIVDVLAEKGSLTGRDIAEHFGLDYYEDRQAIFHLWAVCTSSVIISRKTVGARYLRIDKDTGKLEITPSVPREFADFTAWGLDAEKVASKAEQVLGYHSMVSKGKKALAKRIVKGCGNKLAGSYQPNSLESSICCLLVGDVAYGMSSDFRREVDGEYVKGSDIDIVIIHSDTAPAAMINALDGAIYNQKWRALKQDREELDYIIKSIGHVRKQAVMATPRDSVASKIILESVLIYGSQSLYETVKGIAMSSGVAEKLHAMAGQAILLREAEEKRLLEELVGKHSAQQQQIASQKSS